MLIMAHDSQEAVVFTSKLSLVGFKKFEWQMKNFRDAAKGLEGSAEFMADLIINAAGPIFAS